MISVFHGDNKISHDRFQAWRKANPDGFHMTEGANGHFTVHYTQDKRENQEGRGCRHQGCSDIEYLEDENSCYTKAKKVCSNRLSELMSWAKEQAVEQCKPCKHCDTKRFPFSTSLHVSNVDQLASGVGAVPLSDADILGVLATLEYEVDERSMPDEMVDDRFKVRFRSGWEHSTRDDRKYLRATLKRLTWQNLGNRFGSQIGQLPSTAIDFVFDRLTAFQLSSLTARTSEPTEVRDNSDLPEGAVRQVLVNVYERNPEARSQCIARFGADCVVCGINFGRDYGLIAEGFIHVHHLRPLSTIREEYVVDPVKDLRPVCPNCHAVLHMLADPSRVAELSKTLRARRAGAARRKD